MTLWDQQQANFNALFASISEDVGVAGPLSPDEIQNMDFLACIIRDCFAVNLSAVQEFVSILAFWAGFIIAKVDQNQRSKLFHDIALAFVIACK